MRTKKTTKPAPILAVSSNRDSRPEVAQNSVTTNGKASEEQIDLSDSVILIDESLVGITENGNAEKTGGSDSEKDDKATSSHKENDKPESGNEKSNVETKEPTKIIRLVSIEKLMRPSLLPTIKQDTLQKKINQKQTSIEKPSGKRAKDTSVIEISDTDTEDDDKPLSKKIKTDDVVQNLSSDDEIVPIKKKVSQKATKAAKKLIDDDEDEDDNFKPVVKRQSNQKQQTKIAKGCKSFSLKVEKLPTDLNSFIKKNNLASILDRSNREITTFRANTNHYGNLFRHRISKEAGSSKSKAQDSKSTKSQVIPSSESEDSDKPIAKIVSKSSNIPKNKTMSKRSARSKRQLSESDDDSDSDVNFEVKTGKSKATAAADRTQRARGRSRKKQDSSDEGDDEEENGDGGGSGSDDFEEEKPQPKKKRSRIKKVSSSSSEDDDGNKAPTIPIPEPQAQLQGPSGVATKKCQKFIALDMTRKDNEKQPDLVTSEHLEKLRSRQEASLSDNARVSVPQPLPKAEPPNNTDEDMRTQIRAEYSIVIRKLQHYILDQNRQIQDLVQENRKLRRVVAFRQKTPRRKKNYERRAVANKQLRPADSSSDD